MRSFDVIWSVAVDWTGSISIRTQGSSGNVQENLFMNLSAKSAVNIIE